MKLRLLLACLCFFQLACQQRQAAQRARQSSLAPVFRQQVRNAVLAGNGDMELQALQREVATHPESREARLQLAARYQRSGFPELATEHYRLQLQRNANDEEAALLLAESLAKQQLPEESINVLQQFRQRQQGASASFLTRLAVRLDQSGRLAEGEAAHRSAIAASPLDDHLHNNLGYNLLQQQKPMPAIAALQRALELRPRSETARNNLAAALLQFGASEADILLHLKSLVDETSAHNNLAALYMESGRFEDARRQLQLALRLSPGSPASLQNLQYLSELDGLPATLPASEATARVPQNGQRWWSRLRSWWAPPPSQKTEPVLTGRQTTGEVPPR
jgi:Flp pilus assembly protein TadD